MTESEEVQQLAKKVDDIALRGASKEDIAKLEKLLATASPAPPASPSTPPATGEDAQLKADLEELAKYREADRLALLKSIPKDVIKEFKLEEQPLTEVKRIHTLTVALQKRNRVGIDTKTQPTGEKEKYYHWNPSTQKNEYW